MRNRMIMTVCLVNLLFISVDLILADEQKVPVNDLEVPDVLHGMVPDNSAEKENKSSDINRFDETREEVCLNGVWDFAPLFDRDWQEPSNINETKTLSWEKMRVPGTWRGGDWHHEIEFLPNTVRLSKVDEAWFRRGFKVPKGWDNSSVKIEFGAIGYYAEIYINGRFAGRHVGGFTPFKIEIGRQVNYGQKNELLIFVKGHRRGWDIPPEGCMIASGNRFAGIWQDVFLVRRPKLHTKDIYIKTSVRNKQITAEIELGNLNRIDYPNVMVKCFVADNDKVILSFLPKEIIVKHNASSIISISQKWQDAVYWSPENPYLYDFIAEIYIDNKFVDKFTTRFGFREIWIEGRNFILNGKIVRMRAFHYDHGIPLSMYRPEYLRGYFRALKNDLNYNAVRFFNIVPDVCLDIADEVGILAAEGSAVTSMEISRRSTWIESNESIEKEFAEWIRSHRNHPSIVIWETDNENWCVGFSLVKENRKLTQEYFKWLPAFGFSMENLKKNVDLYYQWLTSLDGWIREHDDTRIITHSGAMLELGFDPTSHNQPDLHEYRFMAGDLGGFMDHYDFHYPYEQHLPAEQAEYMKYWQREKHKPMIVGEFLALETNPYQGYGMKFIGEDALVGGYTAEITAAGKAVSKLLKGWRAAEVSAMFLFWPNFYVFKDVIPKDFKFEWNDMTTPGVKPVKPRWHFYNPGWVPELPEYIPNNDSYFFQYLKESLNPLLITLGGQWEHNYKSEQIFNKDIYIINDTENKQKLKWQAEITDNRKNYYEKTYEITIETGQVLTEKITLGLPKVKTCNKFKLVLNLYKNGNIISRETQAINVFSDSFDRPPEFVPTRIAVYDIDGGASKIFKKLNIQIEPLNNLSNLSSRKFDLLVIGKNSANILSKQTQHSKMLDFLKKGGKLLMFEQDKYVLKDIEKLHTLELQDFEEYSHVQIACNGHAVFNGIDADWLNELNGNFGIATYYPYSRVVKNGCALLFAGFEDSPLIEGSWGKGRYILNQMLLADRYGTDPVATRLVHNILNYLISIPEHKEKTAAYIGKDCRLINRYKIRILDKQNITMSLSLAALSKYDILIIGRDMFSNGTEVGKNINNILLFAKNGGTLFVLPQSVEKFAPEHLPGNISLRKFDSEFIFKEETSCPLLWAVSGIDLSRSYPKRGVIAGSWGILKVNAEIINVESPWESLLLVSTKYGNDDVYAIEPVGGVFPSGGSALARAKYGKGEIILCQLNIDAAAEKISDISESEDHNILKTQALNVVDSMFTNLGLVKHF